MTQLWSVLAKHITSQPQYMGQAIQILIHARKNTNEVDVFVKPVDPSKGYADPNAAELAALAQQQAQLEAKSLGELGAIDDDIDVDEENAINYGRVEGEEDVEWWKLKVLRYLNGKLAPKDYTFHKGDHLDIYYKVPPLPLLPPLSLLCLTLSYSLSGKTAKPRLGYGPTDAI